jgi:hypothetical protein
MPVTFDFAQDGITGGISIPHKGRRNQVNTLGSCDAPLLQWGLQVRLNGLPCRRIIS